MIESPKVTPNHEQKSVAQLVAHRLAVPEDRVN